MHKYKCILSKVESINSSAGIIYLPIFDKMVVSWNGFVSREEYETFFEDAYYGNGTREA